MSNKAKRKKPSVDLLLTLLAVILLAGFAFAVPSGDLKEEAREAYIGETAGADDEYAFLFDD